MRVPGVSRWNVGPVGASKDAGGRKDGEDAVSPHGSCSRGLGDGLGDGSDSGYDGGPGPHLEEDSSSTNDSASGGDGRRGDVLEAADDAAFDDSDVSHGADFEDVEDGLDDPEQLFDEDEDEDSEARAEAATAALRSLHDVGTLTAELDQLDELAGRWLSGSDTSENGEGPGERALSSTDSGTHADDHVGVDVDHDVDHGGDSGLTRVPGPASAAGAEADLAATPAQKPLNKPVTLEYRAKYPDVYSWYSLWFRTHYQRSVDGRRRVWSGAWYDNPEAHTRMESMWRAWEAGRQDPEHGGSRWFLHHADEHMKILMDPEGPFESLQASRDDFSDSTEPLAWRPPQGHVDPPDDDDEDD